MDKIAAILVVFTRFVQIFNSLQITLIWLEVQEYFFKKWSK